MRARAGRWTGGRAEAGLIAGLMALTLLLFLVGVVVEHQVLASHAVAGGPHTTQTGAAPQSGGDGDSAESTAPRTGDAHTTTAATETGSERVFGIAVEDPAVVTAAAFAWLVLIAALLRFGRRLLPVVLLAAAAATLLDVGEIARQVGEARTGLALLAGVVAIGHGALVVIVAWTVIRRVRAPSASDHAPPQWVG